MYTMYTHMQMLEYAESMRKHAETHGNTILRTCGCLFLYLRMSARQDPMLVPRGPKVSQPDHHGPPHPPHTTTEQTPHNTIHHMIPHVYAGHAGLTYVEACRSISRKT
jgi:hypothetical protein